jgi:hypothetical protein
MDIRTLAEHACSEPRTTFVARFHGFFLARTNHPEDLTSGVFTDMIDFASGDARPHGSCEIMRIAKALSNPPSEHISIGRDRSCDVVLRDPSVSRLHASFHAGEDERLLLCDHGSKNGTRVDGVRLRGGEPRPVASGNVLHIGNVTLVLLDAAGLYALF